MSGLGLGRTGADPEARIDIAPLIDVVFLLLIAVIVAATFTQLSSVPIDRPQASTSVPMPERPLVVTVAADGQAWLGDHVWRNDDVQTMRAALAERPRRQVVVHADGQLATRDLMEIIDACRAAGAQTIDIATDPESAP